MAELNEIEQVVRARLEACATPWACRSTSSPRAPTSVPPPLAASRRANERSAWTSVPLAGALQVDLDELLDVRTDDDVVIRSTPNRSGERTTWVLSRPTGTTIAVKMRLEPTPRPAEPRVHPGHDWFFVTEGRVRLWLGDREITIETGEAAEFATMTPHAFVAIDRPAELIVIFDRDGQRAHVHHGSTPPSPEEL